MVREEHKRESYFNIFSYFYTYLLFVYIFWSSILDKLSLYYQYLFFIACTCCTCNSQHIFLPDITCIKIEFNIKRLLTIELISRQRFRQSMRNIYYVIIKLDISVLPLSPFYSALTLLWKLLYSYMKLRTAMNLLFQVECPICSSITLLYICPSQFHISMVGLSK